MSEALIAARGGRCGESLGALPHRPQTIARRIVFLRVVALAEFREECL